MQDESQNPNEQEEVAATPEEGVEEATTNTESAGNEGEGNGTTESGTSTNPTDSEEGADTSETEGATDENPNPEESKGSEADTTDGGEEEETENSLEPTDEERKDYEFLKEQLQTRHLDPDETARFDKLLPKFEKVADSNTY